MKSDLSDFDVFASSDWDGEGAAAVSAQTLKVARDLTSVVRGELGLPDASPSVTGALGLVWNVNNNYLYVSIRNEKIAKFYRRGDQGISEDQLTEAYSAEDLVKELSDKLLSATTTPVVQNMPAQVAHAFIIIAPAHTAIPGVVIPEGPAKWSTETAPEIFKYKVA